jgi:hypothetical protein
MAGEHSLSEQRLKKAKMQLTRLDNALFWPCVTATGWCCIARCGPTQDWCCVLGPIHAARTFW